MYNYSLFSKKSAKYGNQKVYYADQQFDSKKELNRYLELSMLEKGKAISNLQRQVKYVLIPTQYETETITTARGSVKIKHKVLERECSYVADFVYTDNSTGETVVEDVKSDATRTAEYVIKRKLMLFIHHIKVVEV